MRIQFNTRRGYGPTGQPITTARNYRTYSDGTICNKFMVERDGTVRSWDHIGNIYTIHHALTSRQQQMIRAEARKGGLEP